MYSGYDHNGAIISEYGLFKVATYTEKLSAAFTVIPILFNSKDELDKGIQEIKTKLSIDHVGLLWLRGHGTPNKFADFETWYTEKSFKIESIGPSTQIILDACNTTDGQKIAGSIADRFAKVNNCEVFAAKENITGIFPTKIVYKNNIPQVKIVNSYNFFGDEVEAIRIKKIAKTVVKAKPEPKETTSPGTKSTQSSSDNLSQKSFVAKHSKRISKTTDDIINKLEKLDLTENLSISSDRKAFVNRLKTTDNLINGSNGLGS